MKYIFIGNPVNELNAKRNQNKIHFSAADNKAQNILIDGLYKRYGDNLNVISINRDENKKKYGKLKCGAKCSFIKCNEKNRLMYYFSIMINIFFEYKKLLKKYKHEKIVTITWGPSLFYCLGPILNKNKTIFVPFIVTSVEYPEYNGLYKIISNYNIKIMKKADATITYVEQSAIDYTNKPYIHTYYTLTEEQILLARKYKKIHDNKKIIIGYTGQLTKVNGLDILMNVITKLPNKYILKICGKGPLEGDVKMLSEKLPSKIEYLGYLDPINTLKLQLESDILIIIRPIVDNTTKYYSKYAASGKLTEYLLTGNPIITNDIPAINEEFRQYLNIIPTYDEANIIKKIIEVSKDLSKNNKAQSFAATEFSELSQNNKICDFIDKISKE